MGFEGAGRIRLDNLLPQSLKTGRVAVLLCGGTGAVDVLQRGALSVLSGSSAALALAVAALPASLSASFPGDAEPVPADVLLRCGRADVAVAAVACELVDANPRELNCRTSRLTDAFAVSVVMAAAVLTCAFSSRSFSSSAMQNWIGPESSTITFIKTSIVPCTHTNKTTAGL